MKVLVFTNMYPYAGLPFYGSFVRDEVGALRAAGADVDVYFVNGRANKLHYFASPFGFARRLRSRAYDIVHVHHSFCAFVATMQRSTPVVWTFHEGEITSTDDIIRADRPIKRLVYSKRFKRAMARRVDVVIVVSEHLKGPLRRPDALVIPAGVDTASFRPMDKTEAKTRLGLEATRRYVLFPSERGRVEKRYDLALAGVERYRALGGDVELLRLENVPHEQVPLYMNASEAMLMTSAFEASPVTVREALSCNVPVLSTDVGDVRSVIGDLDGCFLVEDDPEDIAQKLRTALDRRSPFAGREKMLVYSLDRTAKQLIALYEELARTRAKAKEKKT